jgi:hypothetical protein
MNQEQLIKLFVEAVIDEFTTTAAVAGFTAPLGYSSEELVNEKPKQLKSKRKKRKNAARSRSS